MLGFENQWQLYPGKPETVGNKELALKRLAMQTHSKSSLWDSEKRLDHM